MDTFNIGKTSVYWVLIVGKTILKKEKGGKVSYIGWKEDNLREVKVSNYLYIR